MSYFSLHGLFPAFYQLIRKWYPIGWILPEEVLVYMAKIGL